MRLLDSNILIYAAIPANRELRRWILGSTAMSAISIVEVLGYPPLTEEEAAALEEFMSMLKIMEVSQPVLRTAASFRRQRKMKLGDAIIAATAFLHGMELVTRNIQDFKHLTEIKIVNPFDILQHEYPGS